MSTPLPSSADGDFRLVLTVRDTVTVLPRCLQILSRRGYRLTSLVSTVQPEARLVLDCTVHGTSNRRHALVRLIERVVDVEAAELPHDTPGLEPHHA